MFHALHRLGVGLALWCCASTSPALAQYTANPLSHDPAYWWTLDDEVTPGLLRSELQSRTRSQERLRQAIAAGLHEPVTEARLAELSCYVEGRLTPELNPMWDAFSLWADRFEYYPAWRSASRDCLVLSGASPDGVETVLAVALDNWKWKQQAMEEVGQRGRDFADTVLAPATERLGGPRVQSLLAVGNLGELARACGRPPAEVADLHQAWLRDPDAEASLRSLKELRSNLGPQDWFALRECLLDTTARHLNHEAYGEEALR